MNTFFRVESKAVLHSHQYCMARILTYHKLIAVAFCTLLLFPAALLGQSESESQTPDTLSAVADSSDNQEDRALLSQPDSIVLSVESVPDSAAISVNGKASGRLTPSIFALESGGNVIEVMKEGFEPLAEKIELMTGRRAKATFLLKSLPPSALVASDLGLEKEAKKIPLDEMAADRIKAKFNGLTVTFAIIPFSQGLMARLLLDDQSNPGDILMISGAVLSAGSFILGKVLSSRKRSMIIKQNEIINQENLEIDQRNKEIDKLVREKNDEMVQDWLSKNSGKGKVIVE